MSWKKYVLCFLSALLGAYIIIFQSYHFDTKNIVYWGFAFYFGGAAVASYQYTKTHPAHTQNQKLIYNFGGWALTLVLIVLIVYGQTYYTEAQLQRYGKRGTAHVSRVYTNSSRHSITHRHICLYFSYKEKTYQQDVINSWLNAGDTVGIFFSTKDPELLELVY